jgi:hypothetical protein
VARVLSSPEIRQLLSQTESDLHRELPEAVETYREHLRGASQRNLQAATNLLTGLQVFKPKSQQHVTHNNPVEDELERRGLSGRTPEELQYFCDHGYFPEEADKFEGKPLGIFGKLLKNEPQPS